MKQLDQFMWELKLQLFLHNFLLKLNTDTLSWTDRKKDEAIRRIPIKVKTTIISQIDYRIWIFMFILFILSPKFRKKMIMVVYTPLKTYCWFKI